MKTIKMKNADKPINPVLTQSPSLQNETSLGLTKREYFAGLAMQGMLANPNGVMNKNGDWVRSPSDFAKHAILFTDELLEQLEDICSNTKE